ncbi:unnamed protein product [Calicophoron daubneyi]|uniref:tRNA (guanine(26)-N(2))-dimethyltransferase n=1 Tax=Calicophoron daubneyi TaxID=300641 RepID=A0AAV2TZA5_CALDB
MTNSRNVVREGKASIRLPDGVFYNRVQEFNRDLTIAVIKHYQLLRIKEWLSKAQVEGPEKSRTYLGLYILEALAASGIRSIRFALEIPHVAKILANDLDTNAVELIKENAQLNGVTAYIDTSCADAVDVMHEHKIPQNRFTVVDIDPYGTASPFLEAAVQCLHEGGLLCVTSTDMAVLCGSTPGTSMGKYGGIAVKNSATQETGLRILLNAIQLAASRHGRVIEPLISLSVDFYARVFVRVWSSPGSVKAIAAKHAICYTCTGCSAYHLQPLGTATPGPKRIMPACGPPVGTSCAECGSPFRVWGPLWIGPLHNRSFLRSFLTTLGAPPKLVRPPIASSFPKFSDNSVEFRDPSQNIYPFGPELSDLLPPEFSFAPNLTSPHSTENISEQYGTYKRIVGMATMAYEELPDVVLYYKVDHLSAVLGTTVPTMLELHSSLLNAGYRASVSHADTNTLKTDAPISLIWDVMIAFDRRQRPMAEKATDRPQRQVIRKEMGDSGEPNEQIKSPTSKKRRRHRKDGQEEEDAKSQREIVRAMLFSRQINTKIDFTLHPDANPPSRVDGLVRYQQKPEKFWGPKARPKILRTD